VPAFGSEWYSRNMYVNGSKENKHSIATYGAHFGYKDLVPLFTAPKFNATAWASIYARAGARYAGPVAEHADGFAMFASKISQWNAAEMGPKRDVVGELAKAIRKEGLRLVTTMHHQWLFAWYPTQTSSGTDAADPKYELSASQGGLYGPKVGNGKCFGGDLSTLKSPKHPPGCEVTPRFNDYFNGKVKEVVDNYQPDVLYFDAKMDWIVSGPCAAPFCCYARLLLLPAQNAAQQQFNAVLSRMSRTASTSSRTTTTPRCSGRRRSSPRTRCTTSRSAPARSTSSAAAAPPSCRCTGRRTTRWTAAPGIITYRSLLRIP